jgi:hypothetical protein
MKINTKQCTPMEGSPEAMVQSNKYILDDDEQGRVLLPTRSTPAPSAEDYSNNDGGREKKYLPAIVYTPILTSKRHHNNQRRLLCSDDMDELNKKLSDLFLENKEDDEEPPSATEAEESNEDDSVETEEESSTANDDPNVGNEKVSLLGRVYRTIFSYKTNTSSQVLRSARHVE